MKKLTGLAGVPSMRMQDMIADHPKLAAAAAHLALMADAWADDHATEGDLCEAVDAWRAVFRPLLTGGPARGDAQ